MSQEKYKYVIDNTISECHRVLSSWERSNKSYTHSEKVALFRNFLSKFFSDAFSGSIYNKCIKRYDPIISLNGSYILEISLRDDNNVGGHHLSGLNEQIKIFNAKRGIDISNTDKKIQEIVNYSKIQNIKF